MPSEAASLILEEDKEIKPGDDGYYYPVVLSAEKLSDDTAFNNMAKRIKDNYHKIIIEHKLGDVPLVVYVNDPVFRKGHQDSSISSDTLISYLKRCKNILTTSKGSGTLKCYRNIDTTIKANDFKNNLPDDNFVILASEYYPDKDYVETRLGKTGKYTISGKRIPLYIYTITKPLNVDSYELGEPLVSLFERLGTLDKTYWGNVTIPIKTLELKKNNPHTH
jgi:hypothetical protein